MNQLWLSNTRHLDLSTLRTQLLPMLNRQESGKFQSFKSEQRRREYLASRALMRMALSHHYQYDPAHWQFSQAENAPPQLLNPARQDLFISLSHSGDYVILAISEQPVGIDIEQAGQRTRALSIAKKVFTSEQQQALDALPEADRLQYFYRLWTQKEALVKALHDSTPNFQMISTKAWPTKGLHISSTPLEDYSIALVSVKPHNLFTQYRAQPFGNINRGEII